MTSRRATAPNVEPGRTGSPRLSRKLEPVHIRAFQRRNELARYVEYCEAQKLSFGPILQWAAVLANLAVFGEHGCDFETTNRLSRSIGLGPLDVGVLAHAVAEATGAAKARGRSYSLMSAAAVGELIELTSAARDELKIRTIDACNEPAAARKRRLLQEKRARKRLRDGAVPRGKSLAATKPWVELGISRTVWYKRQGAQVERGGRTNSVPQHKEEDKEGVHNLSGYHSELSRQLAGLVAAKPEIVVTGSVDRIVARIANDLGVTVKQISDRISRRRGGI